MRVLSRCCFVLMLCLCASIARAQEGVATAPPAAQEGFALDRYAVAVLPLEILSEDSRASELAEAVYDALINELLSIDGIYVVDSGLVLPYTGSDLSPVEIARAIGVGNVVYGEITTHDKLWAVSLVRNDASRGEKPTGWRGFSYFKRIGSGESKGLPDLVQVRDWVAECSEDLMTALFPERQPDQQQVVAKMQAKILDTSSSDAARVGAVQALPHVINASPSYIATRSQAFSGPVASALAQIATHSVDASLRMRVWTALSGVDDPNLIAPLLFALENDAHPQVRGQAALRLIEGFRDAPGVREALEHAAQNDPSERVRKTIRFATLSESEQERELRATILNTSASYRERSSALRVFRFNDGARRELDSEIVVSMVDMARSADTPRARYRVWANLIKSEDPYVVEPLIEELEGVSNDDMNTLAVHELGRFLDYPGVREALEQVAADDASLKLRVMAREALDRVSRYD